MAMNFEKVAAALYVIAKTGSTSTKEWLLDKYGKEIPGFKEVLKYIYDPYFTTGIGANKLMNTGISTTAMDAEQIMYYLKVFPTGNSQAVALANSFIYSTDNKITQWAATGLVTKDLQIGASVTTLNKVFGKGFIPVIGIMRGSLCPEHISGAYIATEKIDGNRRLIMTKPGGVEIYTRSGRRDNGLVEIEEQAKRLPYGYVFDAECIAVGDWASNIECRQASASILNSRGTRRGVKALCFDCIPQEQYDEGVGLQPACKRKAILAGIFGDDTAITVMQKWFMDNNMPMIGNTINAVYHSQIVVDVPNITCLPILGVVTTKAQGIALATPIWETGGEGVMLVDISSPYEVNPNPRKTLLKIKATNEFCLLCTDVFEGDNKYQGMLGAIEVAYTRRGDPTIYSVKVGSGFPDYLRDYYWQHPEEIIGKLVEIESFGESKNAAGFYSLNCPIFKRIRGEKE